eukprot:gene19095-24923_t
MKELYYSWFSLIFNESRVFERVSHTIIEDDKLNHPLIDLDIEYFKRQVILVAQSPPGPRAGNENWETRDVEVFSSLSFIARLASSYYEESFEDIVIRIRASFQEIFHKYSTGLEGLTLLRIFLKFVLDSAKSKMTLVVLVDEVVLFEEGIRSIYPQSDNANDILRTTSPIYMDRNVNTALVISSLLSQPLGITELQSGRTILPFVLVGNLNSTKVIKDWVAFRIYDSLSDKTKRQLELFASTINSNPRMCELAQAEIENCKYLSDYKDMSLEILKTLYENVIARIQGMYSLMLSQNLIYNVLYNEFTPVNDEISEAILNLLGVNVDVTSKLYRTRQDFLLREVFIANEDQIKVYDMKYNSYNNPQQFTNELMNVEVNSEYPNVVIKPNIVKSSQDSFDIGFVLFQGLGKDKRIVLIELKSKDVINSGSDTTKELQYLPRNGRIPEGHQYLHILKVVCDACKSDFELNGTSSLTIKGDNALSGKSFENVYQYVYATTSKGKAFSKWGAIVLVEDDLRLFFSSPFWEIYQSLRFIDF